MAVKAIFVLCAFALLIQCTFSQYFGRSPFAAGMVAPYGWAGRGCGYNGFGYDRFGYDGFGYDGYGYGGAYGQAGFNGFYDWPARGLDVTSTSGGALVVTSTSAVPPVGISIVSDNAFEGILAVAGEVPFVGTTGMEGALPTVGAGAINYGCGDGVTNMVADVAYPIGGIVPGIYSGHRPSTGCGCGRF